nr:MAG TPA: hypothetical protein [Caudoviricetes sp.]
MVFYVFFYDLFFLFRKRKSNREEIYTVFEVFGKGSIFHLSKEANRLCIKFNEQFRKVSYSDFF